MRLEYIVSKNDLKELMMTVEGVKDIIVDEKSLNSDSCFFVVSTKSNSEDSAKRLSELNEKIIKYGPIVLANESAAYFNKRLFPLINDFERILRKLLYSASALRSDVTTISDLEKKILAKYLICFLLTLSIEKG